MYNKFDHRFPSSHCAACSGLGVRFHRVSHKQQKTRAAVRVAIFDALEQLPEIYTHELYDQKCEVVFQNVYDTYG